MIDWARLGQAVLVQACQDAVRDDEIGQWARWWLTAPDIGLRDSIIDGVTPYTQDDLNKLVERYESASPR